jgi:hypothetical protein
MDKSKAKKTRKVSNKVSNRSSTPKRKKGDKSEFVSMETSFDSFGIGPLFKVENLDKKKVEKDEPEDLEDLEAEIESLIKNRETQSKGLGIAPNTGPGTGPNTGPGTGPNTGPGTMRA